MFLKTLPSVGRKIRLCRKIHGASWAAAWAGKGETAGYCVQGGRTQPREQQMP